MKLKIVQNSQVNWHVQSPNGTILQKDITIASHYDAERFIKNYVSSFTNWGWEVVPMEHKPRGSK